MTRASATALLHLICLPVLWGTPHLARAQVSGALGSLTTGATVNAIFSEINDSIDHARNTGNYLATLGLVRVKDALDVWVNSNSELLDKAFSDLDEASKENFGRVRSAISEANSAAEDRLATASELTDSANQLVASIQPGSKPYISRFSPRLVPPTATASYTIKVRGVSLDSANPNLALETGTAKRALIGPNEVQFSVPISATPSDDTNIQVKNLQLTYTQPKSGFMSWIRGAKEEVLRQLPIVILPNVLGTYTIEGTRKIMKREVDTFSQDLGQFKGTNRREHKIANPRLGWRWDASNRDAFSWQGSGGEKGRCEGIEWNNSGEHGIDFYARLDRIGRSIRYPNGAPGKISCTLTGPVYRMVETTESIGPLNGKLTWTADALIALPAETDSIKVTVRTFDGRVRAFTSSDTDSFFDLRKDGEVLTLVPKVPSDLLASQ